MTYLFWVAPAFAVVLSIASGKVGILGASLVGLAVALMVALSVPPQPFTLVEAAVSLARGAWIGWIIIPYIMGGLFFWQIALPHFDSGSSRGLVLDDRSRRKALFTACFLIGPFAESATGFGVGIVGTMALVKRLGVERVPLLAFGLLSQTMILWGAMGSGAIVAAAFARLDPTSLTVQTSIYFLAFNALWLPCYWRLADRSGIVGGWRARTSEFLWLAGALISVIVTTAALGPETAMLASYGPIIVLRFVQEERPSLADFRRAWRRMAPFVVLISCLVVSRAVPPIKEMLEVTGRLRPFDGAPAWSPFFHAGSWLLAAGLVTGCLRGDVRSFKKEAVAAWRVGRLAVLTIISFAMMSELLVGSGVAHGLARGVFEALGQWSILVTPLISAIFGAIANSGNAANGLFMASQLSLAAEAGLSVAAVASLQQAAALSLNIVSPVRISIVCAMAGLPGRERDAYRIMTPFAVAVVVVLIIASLLVAANAI